MLAWLMGWLVLYTSPAMADARNLKVVSGDGREQRVALVIGNAAYPGVGALKNPANDARDIGAKLKRLGFEVIARTDLKQKDMLRALTEFGDKVQPGSEALFFYAGHGMQVRGRNYLIPVDAEIKSEGSVSSEAVDVDQLLDKLAPARLSMVILDACRNNPFERRFRGGGQGLAQINAPTGTLIAYATAPGKVAADGEGRNGLYTAELLAAMDVPGIRIEDVFKRVRANVVKKSNEAQTPWESSSLTGDFYFRPGSNAPAGTAIPTVAVPNETTVELGFWESAERGDTAEDYNAYVKKFPQGQFLELARIRLAKLSDKPATVPSAAVASVARGPVIAPALPKEGDYWRYRGSNPLGPDSPTYRVTKVAPGTIELSFVTNANDATTLVLNGDWNPLAQRGSVDISFNPYMPQFNFPLEPGKKWRAHYQTDCGFLCDLESDFEGEVRGWETVTVPAGTFETLRIDYRDTSSHGTGFGSLWFSPAVRRHVKQEYQMTTMRYYYELESYQIAK